MTDKEWLELAIWGCTIGMVASAAIMGIVIGRAMNRSKREAILKRLNKENEDG